MFFEGEISEDKGLFTFYREQAEREERQKRDKKLLKQLKKKKLAMPSNQPICMSPSKQLSPIKLNTIRKVESLRQEVKKVKPAVEKIRLIQSVVDMSRHIQDSHENAVENQVVGLKMKESSFIVKSRKYRQKISEFNQSLEQQKVLFQDEYIPDEIRVQSFHRRNQSEDFADSRIKAAIHTSRGSLELPDIRKTEEQKLLYKPKKSIKSKLLQQAMISKDRDRIRDIRDHLNSLSVIELQNEQEAMKDYENCNYNSKTFQIFQFRQQSMLLALKRIKKRL